MLCYMTRHNPHARARLDAQVLTPGIIRTTVLSLFGRRHAYGDSDIAELIPEMARFGITTRKPFLRLMKKHRRALIEEARRKMPRAETVWHAAEFGPEGLDTHAGRSWYAITGQVRIAMQLEFGEDACVYEPRPDSVDE